MKLSTLSSSFITTLILGLTINFSLAEDLIFGWQLMTKQERIEHQAKMDSLTTEEEREAFRFEHHKEMELRAKERGVLVPETPQNE